MYNLLFKISFFEIQCSNWLDDSGLNTDQNHCDSNKQHEETLFDLHQKFFEPIILAIRLQKHFSHFYL